jgi:hypothetical protein
MSSLARYRVPISSSSNLFGPYFALFFGLRAVLPRRTIRFRSFAHPLGLPCLVGIVLYETLVAIGGPVISIDRMRLCIIREKHSSPPHSSHSIGFLGGLGNVAGSGTIS